MSKHPILKTIASRSPHMGWIEDNTVLFVRHGSHAYGTNTPESDTDFKGIAIPTKPYFLGSTHRFEQAELKAPDPDCTIFDIRKFFDLAANCNPSIIEVLYVEPEDRLVVDPIGEIILQHRDEFLSKKVKHTFMGYAVSQLKRIKLHRRHLLNPPKEPPTRASLGLPEHTLILQDQLAAATAEIQKHLDRHNFDFMDGLEEPVKIGMRTIMSEMMAELKISSQDQWMSAARTIGLDDNFILLMQKERQYTGAKKEWEQYQNWKKTRNPKRAADEAKWGLDLKHAMHLTRLSRMAKEILTTGKVIVKRPDYEELLSIRNGAWTYEQVVEYAERAEQELNSLYQTCNVLPNSPDREKLDRLCIELVEKSLSRWSGYRLRKSFNRLVGGK
jgi:predicted nucleotidyltransferase